MAADAFVVYTTATEDGSGYGTTVDNEGSQGFGEGYRVWKGRDFGSKIRLHIIVGSGDTIKVFGKFLAADDFIQMGSYTADTLAVLDPMPLWVIQRTAGTSTDSIVTWAP